jgi:hypothetical protein
MSLLALRSVFKGACTGILQGRVKHGHGAPNKMLALFLPLASQAICGGSPCVVAAPCGPSLGKSGQWTLVNKSIDGLVATNLVLARSSKIVNCAAGNACHMWGPGFGDRNGVLYLHGSSDSFTVRSWPISNGSLPVGPGQTGPGQCLAAESGGSTPPAFGDLTMSPCDDGTNTLKFKLGDAGVLEVLSDVPVATPLCLGAPPPPPDPPPNRPSHYFSCTKDLAGGVRLPHAFCNSSLPEAQRLDALLAAATCAEKAAAITSSGAAIPRLGVPRLGSAEDTHGVGGGCIPAANRSNNTGCPTTFPAGPGLGATFDRGLWQDVGTAIGMEARGLNNLRVGPLYFLDPDINLLRDPRWCVRACVRAC